MASERYQYEVNRNGRISITSTPNGEDFESLASDFAEDYHQNQDGWESSWPVDMVIFEYSENDDGKELWRGSVDRELVPHFRAYAAKP